MTGVFEEMSPQSIVHTMNPELNCASSGKCPCAVKQCAKTTITKLWARKIHSRCSVFAKCVWLRSSVIDLTPPGVVGPFIHQNVLKSTVVPSRVVCPWFFVVRILCLWSSLHLAVVTCGFLVFACSVLHCNVKSPPGSQVWPPEEPCNSAKQKPVQ